MADTKVRTTHGPTFIRVESGSLIAPEDVGAEIVNMYPTEEGTLRAVWGPSPYTPDYGSGYPSFNGNLHGIGHFTMVDGRELLLIQWGDTIRVFEGWEAAGTPADMWEALIGPAATSPQVVGEFGSDLRPRFPAQFERTPGGVVIIPRGANSRPYFYDGRVVLPLGYDRAPSPPIGWGPESNATAISEDPPTSAVNAQGYHHDGSVMHDDFRTCRVGTVTTEGLTGSGSSTTGGPEVLGTLQRGHYEGAVQWIDRWGNLSPQSGRSNSIVILEEKGYIDATSNYDLTVEYLLKQLAWTGIEPGPEGTVGRVLLRTKDQLHSGSLALYEVPANNFHGSLAFATIPDNDTDLYPDNVPDSSLLIEGVDAVPVRPFKLYKTAFGHGFAANYEDDPGLLRWTMPGRWGTFQENDFAYVDPHGAEITGMHAVAAGLLVFTEASTFLIEQKDIQGLSFRAKTVHSSIGCSAPSSIKTLPNGQTVWLSREGFCTYEEKTSAFGGSQGEVEVISRDIDRYVRDFNRARLLQAVALVDPRTQSYRCWVAWRGSTTNNMCWEYDGTGWRQRDDMTTVSGACVTDDHRRYPLVVGQATNSSPTTVKGVWLLDHQNRAWTPQARDAVIETSWLRVVRSKQRGSPMEVYFWLRETESGVLSVEVFRDWRKEASPETFTVQLHPTDDVPPFWGTTTWNATKADGSAVLWPRRRPYWIRGSLFVPSVEVFKLRITHTGDLDFVGMTFDEVLHGDTLRVPR